MNIAVIANIKDVAAEDGRGELVSLGHQKPGWIAYGLGEPGI
ncbi:MAG: hypothetical protein ACREQT_18140 [Candidatus Binataceae bacterium]